MRRPSIVGPIAMITVGVLFLLKYFTYYSFRQTWPVLLIAIGAAMIFERYVAPQPSGYVAAGADSTSDKVNHG